MQDQPITRVAVVGTGMMGPGIAQVFATGGKQVTLMGRSPESVARGRAAIEANLAALQGAELLTASEVEQSLASVRYVTNLEEAVADAELVVESIVEELASKQEIFGILDRLCPPSTILTSNTSGLRITWISERMEHPERAATTHFWNPPHLVPLVEIVNGERTSLETVERLRRVLTEIGKRPVAVWKDVPGQLGARLLHAITREAMYIVQEGIASPEEVDEAIKTGLGLRFPVYGPLEHADAVGIDLTLAVASYLHRELCSSQVPLEILTQKAVKGDLGMKTGHGFYDWTQRDPAALKAKRDEFLMARLKDLYPFKKG